MSIPSQSEKEGCAGCKASKPPQWRKDFPIEWEGDHYVSRREMVKFLTLGSLLLAAGAKGKRNSLPHGRIMIHQPLAGMEGTATDIMIHAEEFIRMKKQLNAIYQKHTGQTLERLQEDTDRDRFMSPEESREYGLIDNVVDREPPIALNPNPIP